MLEEGKNTQNVKNNVCYNQSKAHDVKIFEKTSLSSKQINKYHSYNDEKEDKKEKEEDYPPLWKKQPSPHRQMATLGLFVPSVLPRFDRNQMKKDKDTCIRNKMSLKNGDLE